MLKQLTQIIIGLLLWIILLYVLFATNWSFLQSTLHVIKGGLVLLIFLIGLGLILIGITESK